jgi:phospholipid-binding lipoprotein MlaA
MNYFMRIVAALALVSAMSGCATVGEADPRDPLEGFNRAMFRFNDTFDKTALKPAARIYEDALPSFVQTAVGNFFGNLGDIWTLVNDVLQAKRDQGASDFMRIVLNTSFGLGGLIDIASDAGLTKHKEDFGQTLGRWGMSSGPYVVLPFFGPSTLRDSAAMVLDFKGDVWAHVTPVNERNVGIAVRAVDQRAAVLNASNLIEDAALDPYQFIRDAYLQRREGQIHDEDKDSSKEKD